VNLLPIALLLVFAQGDEKLAFDVAVIKPQPKDQRARLNIDPGGRLTAEGFSLKSLIAIAYKVTPSQMAGGESWVENDRWSIQAKAEGITSIPAWSPPYLPEMVAARLRSLLEDRFQLKFHRKPGMQQSYILVEGKSGSKMVRAEAPEKTGAMKAGPGVVIGMAATVPQLVVYLNRLMDRPVVDQTGLTGYFDFKLQFAPETAAADQPASSDPSIFTAIQEQLGLKLEAAKLPVELFVIDAVQKPSAN
jgi:uncharacterized protein (TIGR03435 family)